MRPLRPSTLKSSCASVLALLALGCAPPKERVYIDIDRAWLESPEVLPSVGTLPTGNSLPAISGSSSLKAVQAQSLANTEVNARLAAARQIMARHRAAALTHLRARLFASYSRQVDRLKAEGNARILSEAHTLLDAALESISAEIERYASERWPAMNRLALLVGFPLPPKTKLREPGESLIEQRRHQEALALYRQLEEAEAKFESRVAGHYDTYFAQLSKLRLDLGVEVVEKLDEYEQLADQEARKTVESVNESIRVSLLDASKISLPALSARTSSVSEPKVTLPNDLNEEGKSSRIISTREEVEEDLSVWLGINRYSLGPKVMSRDETENFIKWRQSYRIGHSAKSRN